MQGGVCVPPVKRNPYFQCHGAACVVPSKFMASAQVSYLLSRKILQLPYGDDDVPFSSISSQAPKQLNLGLSAANANLRDLFSDSQLTTVVEIDREFQTWDTIWPAAAPKAGSTSLLSFESIGGQNTPYLVHVRRGPGMVRDSDDDARQMVEAWSKMEM